MKNRVSAATRYPKDPAAAYRMAEVNRDFCRTISRIMCDGEIPLSLVHIFCAAMDKIVYLEQLHGVEEDD